jgi:hypothetical protein
MSEQIGSPFDAESLRALSVLPVRNGLITSLLGLCKIIAIPLLIIGGGGVIRALLYTLYTKGDNDHILGILLGELLVWGLAFCIGGALWAIHEHFIFTNAPLGNLATLLFEGLQRGKNEKVGVICASIVRQTGHNAADNFAGVLLRALAFQALAELSSNPQSSVSQAEQAIPLFEQCLDNGQKTPLVYFGLATSARLAKKSELAIDSYRHYLLLRPADTRTREIYSSLSPDPLSEGKVESQTTAVEETARDDFRPYLTSVVGVSDEPQLFTTEPEKRGGMPLAAWGVAALIVIVAVGVLVFAGRKKPVAAPNTLQPADAYAASLPLSQFAMSESANLSGGKLTYLDGHIGNTGDRTVTAVTVQAVFRNDEQMPPQIDTVPLTLIRVKEPYIDTEPVSAAPIKPGDDREFRLTFETVPENWNQQMPEVRVIRAGVR